MLWRDKFQEDPLCLMSNSGSILRKRMLEHGGMIAPQDLVESTLGKGHLTAKAVAKAIASHTGRL